MHSTQQQPMLRLRCPTSSGLHKGVKASQPPPIRRTCRVRAFQEPPAAQPPQEVQDKDLQLVRKDMEILKYQLISTFKEELAASTAALRAEQAASTAALRAEQAASTAALRAELASKADLAASTAALMAEQAASTAALRAELASKADLVALQEQLQQNNRLTICLLVGAAVVGREELLNVLKALFGVLKVA